MPEHKLLPLPEGASAPPLRGKPVLIAVHEVERLGRILAGHDLTVPRTVDEAKAELEKREFAMIVLGVNSTSRACSSCCASCAPTR